VEQARNLLIGMLSHDLRTPLQTIQMTARHMQHLKTPAEIAEAAARMIRSGDFKYIDTHGHPAQLYDLRADPLELHNLAGRGANAAIEARLRDALLAGWDADTVMASVMASQRRRLYLKDAAGQTAPRPSWDYQATRDDSRRFVRASGAAGAKALARFPFVPPPK
jgi:choline-sulfatase